MERTLCTPRNRRSVAELLGKPLSVVPQHRIRRENAFASHFSGANFANAALRAAVQVPSACVRTPRDDDDLRRDHLAPTITFKSGVPHRTTLQQHSQLHGGFSSVVCLRATFCLTYCAGLLFAGARCTVQSGRIARSAPECTGTRLDELYGIRCPRPPALALPALVLMDCHSHSRPSFPG